MIRREGSLPGRQLHHQSNLQLNQQKIPFQLCFRELPCRPPFVQLIENEFVAHWHEQLANCVLRLFLKLLLQSLCLWYRGVSGNGCKDQLSDMMGSWRCWVRGEEKEKEEVGLTTKFKTVFHSSYRDDDTENEPAPSVIPLHCTKIKQSFLDSSG